MAHVRTQVRNAVINRLKGEFGDDFVGDAMRTMRQLQKADLPFIAAAIGDSVSPSDRSPPGQRVLQRDFDIAIRSSVHEDDEDALATLDAIVTRIEKSLYDGAVLGVGRLANWQLNGTSGPEAVPTDEGMLIAVTTTYTASMFTTDVDPESNLQS